MNNSKNNSNKRSFFNYAVMPLLIFAIIMLFSSLFSPDPKEKYEQVMYHDFTRMAENGEIDTVYLDDNDGKYFYFTITDEIDVDLKEKNLKYTNDPKYDEFKKELLENNINIDSQSELSELGIESSENTTDKKLNILANILSIALTLFLLFMTFRIFSGRTNSETSNPINELLGVGDNSKEYNESNVTNNDTFDNILGLKEVKKDMLSLVDFIKNKEKYINAGAELPRGVILYGPPGTGKTMLARAVAKEAEVPFYYQCGSDFVEKYVGVGAERIRNLFKKAKNNAPCIIFIDEIDAIGGNRNGYSNNGEDLKTINALLSEMDGFSKADNVLVIATTNRLEALDPALVRAGRFTNKYCVPLPETPEEREDIINFYLRDKKIGEDVDVKALAKNTIGCSPADIKTIVNEAAIISVQQKANYITNKMIDDAMMKNILEGHLKEDQTKRDKKELKIVSVHEAGHALLGKLLKKDVTKVTILATTNGAGGVTFTIPEKMGLHTVDELKQEVITLYGGRAAEKLIFGENNITTGASNDIEKASEIIKKIVSSYGFNEEYGMLNLEKLKVDNKAYLEEEIKLAKELEAEADKMLTENKDKLQKIAKELMKRETIYSDELDKIIFENNDSKELDDEYLM